MLLDEAKDLHLQIRYADTDEQKDFKAKTAKSRQFKSTEYNRGLEWVYGYRSTYRSQLWKPSSSQYVSFQWHVDVSFSDLTRVWMTPKA